MSKVDSIDMNKLPEHIAIIMDGNGRWAQKRGLPRTVGHRQGIKTVKRIIQFCSDIGIKYLTLYTFSTENWKRPYSEVNALFKLFVFYLRKEIKELNEKNVKMNFIGKISAFDDYIKNEINNAKKVLDNNTGLVVNLALNYGGRTEILDAVKSVIKDYSNDELELNELDEHLFSRYLYMPDVPSPDLLIRSGGEYRISNFLLWEIAYTELWFSDVLWPDFTEEHIIEAIIDYQNRQRRYGGI